MTDPTITAAATREPADFLAWEDLAHRSAWPAFRDAVADLLLRPTRFFTRMATSGGLCEPLTFFGILLTLCLFTAFPAALAWFGVTAPDPELVGARAYSLYAIPPRLTGLLLALLPLSVVAVSLAMTLAGSLFHAGAKLFGARRWEGSASVWLYSAASALVPAVVAGALLLVVCLAGYAVSLKTTGAKESVIAAAKWSALGLSGGAFLAALALFVTRAVIGCTRAFQLEPVMGTAAALAGIAATAAAVGVCAWAFAAKGTLAGTAATAVATTASVLVYLLAPSRGDAVKPKRRT